MSQNKIPLAGVIGCPIAHSRSPQLHGHWLSANNVAGFYVPMDIAPDDLETMLRALPKAGFVGVNVTIPHKEAALQIADEVSERARLIGAANTLTFLPDGRIHADNTDGYGFLTNLRAGAPEWEPASGPAVVLGAGGAARAVLVSLLEAGVPKITLSNRTQARAEQLQTEFGDRITVQPWDTITDSFPAAALLVNTTSLGMTGKPPLDMDLNMLNAQAVVTDLVYTPLQTGLLQQAAARGCTTVDGLGMLLHQGAPGFARWFGAEPVVDDALRRAVLG
ncbi:shikimate dehydrogenase [uncultured Roseobacter sp.]|uniref:shikimate dehydrogenase n=1 Tax=uncultured Roseobacter sp. TaxID=114847 RepID=UPI00262CD16B|nr:shikimate dehydrogenase [uncultured Roseobacter sp.]